MIERNEKELKLLGALVTMFFVIIKHSLYWLKKDAHFKSSRMKDVVLAMETTIISRYQKVEDIHQQILTNELYLKL
ncbi:hypothetical protein AWH56_009185 [Anaerobacillus isosaccharinicus]|uniref:Uncharacterized protein n=1 Tax=Anaerobacillus isosaccharinicus TaxID=1532552 RepID=A0A1S2MDM6_9BACI|nr:hypothetical protein [Anaerobacillus isosaccharinicus]MBA5588879.1 hypothetical protein [Anaerobacillus isosaccharinicus]QOY37734.1 hypothetical protein AWH56_009185 [Anaerobacillus isosaccharinicus]